MDKPNPSLGLWTGPLTPASDCRECILTCVTLQALIGFSLFRAAIRTPAIAQNMSKWSIRGARAVSIAAGSWVLFRSSIELARFGLPYDPWVDDARAARQAAPEPVSQYERIKQWWFGPPGYEACSFSEWRTRVQKRLGRPLSAPDGLEKQYETTKRVNRNTASRILAQIELGTLDVEPLPLPITIDEDIDVDELEFEDLDVWEHYNQLALLTPYTLVVVATSAREREANDATLHMKVNFNLLPEAVKLH